MRVKFVVPKFPIPEDPAKAPDPNPWIAIRLSGDIPNTVVLAECMNMKFKCVKSAFDWLGVQWPDWHKFVTIVEGVNAP